MKEMSPERWERISTLLDRLLDEPPASREALLASACGDDERLASQVRELLAAADRSGILEKPAGAALQTLLSGLAGEEDGPETSGGPGREAGRRIGVWRLEREIGRGGMGVVYLAARVDAQFEQQVAVKLLRRGLDSDEILERFLQERRILARLQDPRIAGLLDGGVTEDGRPWFAMEFVEGETITAWCAQRGAGVEQRLRLFRQVCAAVQYAHRNLVIHRDLKPSNILVTRDGQVKLLDFGIAKLLADEPGVDRPRTRADLRVMTPEYAAPEQVRGETATTATDVYALGVVLYELLSGARPYRADPTDPASLERAVLESRITRPSRVAKPARLQRRLRGDLDAIVMTALRREPERRYATAEALSQDLARHLAGMPVEARGEGMGYRVGTFVRRHRLGVAAATLVFLALLAGLAGTAWQARRAAREARRAQEVKDFLVDIFRLADPTQTRGEKLTARELLDHGARRVESELSGQPELQAEMMSLLADVYRQIGLYDQALPLAQGALETRRTLHGPTDPGVASSLRQEGAILFDKGSYEEAEPPLRDALAMHRQTLGPQDPEVAEDLDTLAILLRARGKLDEAESLARESLAIRRSTLGDADPAVTDSLNNLAVMLREKGDYAHAEELYREVLDKRRPVLGDFHPGVLLAINNLAALVAQQGRTTEAIDLNREALGLCIRLYGDDHPATARSRNNLATVLLKEARYQEAEDLFRQVLGFWTKTEAADHPNAVVTRNNLGAVLEAKGDLKEAEAMFRELEAFFRKQLGPEHPYTAVALGHLANVLRLEGRYDEAQKGFDEALTIRRKVLGEEHPDVATTLYQQGMLALDRGRPSDAEHLHDAALAMRRKLLPADHPSVGASEVAAGTARLELGDAAASEPLQRHGLEILRAAYPQGHPEVASAEMALARTLMASDRAAEAEALLREAVAIRTDRFGAGSWLEAEAAEALAACLIDEGKSEEARGMLTQAAGTLHAALGPGHRLSLRADADTRRLRAR